MKKLTSLVVALMAVAGCNPVVTVEKSCEIECATDDECPDAQTCGELGLCSAGEACETGTCTPGAFLGCDDQETARICDETGTTLASERCSFGCNADAARCNECAPEDSLCTGNDLVSCGTDGLIASTETCNLGCANATAESDTRCQHITPFWIPTACEVPAISPQLAVTVTTLINTDVDANCTGGIVAQTSGPAICTVRHRTISLAASVSVIGSRAIAFVSDGALDVSGFLDVGANTTASGPGGGRRPSGAKPGGGGGGGAGGNLPGARGGGLGEFGASSGEGGLVFDQLGVVSFEGGQRASRPQLCAFDQLCPTGGGGGGALMLVSCSGRVTVSGTIDAGGGGGTGGGDANSGPKLTSFFGGAGGGAGGYVVLQGAEVAVTGNVFANGGGGGGGCSADNCVAFSGQDGAVFGIGGRGGLASGEGGAGGAGSIGTASATVGHNVPNVSPGGGGGSAGRLQIHTPAGVAPTVAPSAKVEPAFETHRTVTVR